MLLNIAVPVRSRVRTRREVPLFLSHIDTGGGWNNPAQPSTELQTPRRPGSLSPAHEELEMWENGEDNKQSLLGRSQSFQLSGRGTQMGHPLGEGVV